MKKILNLLYLFVFCYFFNISLIYPQSNINEVIEKIENGFEKNDVSFFSDYFNTKISLNLTNGTNGNFSNKQAFYIFQKYFKDYKVSKCVINKKIDGENQFSVTGNINFIYKGQNMNSSIYLNIKKELNTWKILHITIN